MGVQGLDRVGRPSRLAQATDVEADLKRPEVHALQFNRLGRDAQGLFLGVVSEVAELVLGLPEVEVDVSERRARPRCRQTGAVDVGRNVRNVARQLFRLFHERREPPNPTAAAAEGHAPLEGLQACREVQDLRDRTFHHLDPREVEFQKFVLDATSQA